LGAIHVGRGKTVLPQRANTSHKLGCTCQVCHLSGELLRLLVNSAKNKGLMTFPGFSHKQEYERIKAENAIIESVTNNNNGINNDDPLASAGTNLIVALLLH
jgi:hypothetical protein